MGSPIFLVSFAYPTNTFHSAKIYKDLHDMPSAVASEPGFDTVLISKLLLTGYSNYVASLPGK